MGKSTLVDLAANFNNCVKLIKFLSVDHIPSIKNFYQKLIYNEADTLDCDRLTKKDKKINIYLG